MSNQAEKDLPLATSSRSQEREDKSYRKTKSQSLSLLVNCLVVPKSLFMKEVAKLCHKGIVVLAISKISPEKFPLIPYNLSPLP